jgi:hypothetical protein
MEDTGLFIYLNPSSNRNPYDLEPISAPNKSNTIKARDGLKDDQKLNKDRFYTMSKKGLTAYYQEGPQEFISLTDWLIERNFYNHISELKFFKQFKRWKILRMWRRNIL